MKFPMIKALGNIFVLTLFIAIPFVLDTVFATPSFEKVMLADDTIRIKTNLDSPMVDIKLVENTDNCLVDCHAILRITPYDDITFPADSNSEFNWEFLKGRNWMPGLDEYHFEILRNLSYTVEMPVYENQSYSCSLGNESHENETCWHDVITDTRRETRYRDSYQNFGFWGETLKGGKEYTIKLAGKKHPTIGMNNVDWVPTFLGLKLNEWEWWNSSWSKCRNITLDDPLETDIDRVYEPVYLDISGLIFSNATREIRIIDSPCHFEGNEIPSDTFPETNQTLFLANRSAGTDTIYSVYYDNGDADEPDYSESNFNVSQDSNYIEPHWLNENGDNYYLRYLKTAEEYGSDGSGYGWVSVDDFKVNGITRLQATNPANDHISIFEGRAFVKSDYTNDEGEHDSQRLYDGNVIKRINTTVSVKSTSSFCQFADINVYKNNPIIEWNIYQRDTSECRGKNTYNEFWDFDTDYYHLHYVNDSFDEGTFDSLGNPGGVLFQDSGIYWVGGNRSAGSRATGITYGEFTDSFYLFNKGWSNDDRDGIRINSNDTNSYIDFDSYEVLTVLTTDSSPDSWQDIDDYFRGWNNPLSVTLGGETEMCPDDDTFINEDTTFSSGLSCSVHDANENGVLIINASNIVVDCNNMILSEPSPDSYEYYTGIRMNGINNVTLKNCDLRDYSHGVRLNNSRNISIHNSFIDSERGDVYLINYSNATLVNATFSNFEYNDYDYTSRFTVKWYVRANVSNQTDSLDGATVYAFDKDSNLLWTEDTDTGGLTDWYLITEYVRLIAPNSGLIEYTPHTFTASYGSYVNETLSLDINQSQTVNLVFRQWNITFDVRSGEDGSQLSNVNIYCDYEDFEQGGDTSNPYGPYLFPQAEWECTFEKTLPEYYNKTVSFTTDSDKTIDVVLGLKGELTNEEHDWLEKLYNCLYLGIEEDCEAMNHLEEINASQEEIQSMLEEINQTVTSIWEQSLPTDDSVVLDEDVINTEVNDTYNLTINYSVYIPVKAGYDEGDFLPVRIKYWFMDDDDSCISQGDPSSDGFDMIEPYCIPLTVYTIGEMDSVINFTVQLRPSLSAGEYTIIRSVEIDPNQVWINYGQGSIGSLVVTKGNEVASVGIEKATETLQATSPPSNPLTGLLTSGLLSTTNISMIFSAIALSIAVFLGLSRRNN